MEGTGAFGPRMPGSSEPPPVSRYHEEAPGSVVVGEAWVPAKHWHNMYSGPRGAVERKAKPRLGQTGAQALGAEVEEVQEAEEAEKAEEETEEEVAEACAAPACRTKPPAAPSRLPRRAGIPPPPGPAQDGRPAAAAQPSPPPRPGRSRQTAPASTPPAQRPRSEAAQAAREGLCLLQRGAGGGGGRLP